MAKTFKQLTGGLSSLIPTDESPEVKTYRKAVQKLKDEGLHKAGRKKRTDKDNATAPSAERGTKPGEMRKTYLVNMQSAEKIDSIAYWDRRSVKEVINEAMEAYIVAWEKRNGKVKNANK